MSKALFVAWSFTSTKMQECIRNVGEEKMRTLLVELLERCFGEGTAVEIVYKTELFTARGEKASYEFRVASGDG